jgi:hypothetical protein
VDNKYYTLSPGDYNSKPVITITFKYTPHLKKELKKRFPSARWVSENKFWYLS